MLVRVLLFAICYSVIVMVSSVFSKDEPQCSSRFDYEYKVVQKLVDLENSQKAQDKIIDELVEKNSALENEIENIEKESKAAIALLQSEVKDSNMDLQVATGAIDSFTARLDNLNSSIKGIGYLAFYGFSAYEAASRSVSVGSTIVLSRTRLNEGDAYDAVTGQFTAPVDGVYIFHATFCTHTSKKYIYAAFMTDNGVIGRVAANDLDWDTCHSGSALARLQKGIKVYLKVTAVSSGQVFTDDGNHMNSFSGFLVGI